MCSLAIDKDARKEEGGGGGYIKTWCLWQILRFVRKLVPNGTHRNFFFLPT